jgi:hypothetical protein
VVAWTRLSSMGATERQKFHLGADESARGIEGNRPAGGGLPDRRAANPTSAMKKSSTRLRLMF